MEACASSFAITLAAMFPLVCSYDLKVMPSTNLIERDLHSNLLLTCTPEDVDDQYELAWIDNNRTRVVKQISESTNGVGIDTTDGKYMLVIKNVGKYHEGIYVCQLLINRIVVKEVQRELKLYVNFGIARAPKEQYLGAGTDGFIICEPKPDLPQVLWKRDGQKIKDGGRYIFNWTGMIIKSATFTDGGVYSCEISRSHPPNFEMEEIVVKVFTPLTIAKGIPQNAEGVEDTDYSIICKANGDPPPEYQFFLKGEPFINESRIIINPQSGHLFFGPLKRTDEGEVSCIARNVVSEVKSTGYLTVSILPAIISFLESTIEGENMVILECLAEGKPTPSITISKLEPEKKLLGQTSTVTIYNVSAVDSGKYACKVDSELGSEEKYIYIIVKFKPEPVPNQRLTWTSYALNRRNITCFVRAYPPVTFKWFFNDLEIGNNSTFRIFSDDYSSFLEIFIAIPVQAWIYGTYDKPPKLICRANNSEGSTDIVMSFGRSGAPTELKNVSYKIYPCEIQFDFSLPEYDGGEPILGISVMLFSNTTLKFPLSNHVRVGNLQPQTLYEVILAAYNGVGEGENDYFELKTLSPSKPFPIIILSNDSSSEVHEATVVWEEPIDTCVPVLGYKIKYRKINIDSRGNIDPLEDWHVTIIQDELTLSANLTELSHDSFYQIEVFVENMMGWSEYSNGLIVKTEPEPVENDEPSTTQSGFLLVNVILLVGLILFLIMVDVSCYISRKWGLLQKVLSRNKSKHNNDQNRKILKQDHLLTRNAFNVTLPSFKSQEEFVALTPTEDQSDNQRITFSFSESHVTSSSIDSELGTYAGEIAQKR